MGYRTNGRDRKGAPEWGRVVDIFAHPQMFLSKSTIAFLARQLSIPVSSLGVDVVGGGSINHTYRLTVNGRDSYFLKQNDADRHPGLFEKERNGLLFLAEQHCLRIPQVIFCDLYNNEQLLVLEWIQPCHADGLFWKQFGEQLSRLHQCTHNQFGFAEDNYMGALPQSNDYATTWTAFFVTNRLMPQVQLAVQNDLLPALYARQFEKLYLKLDTIFTPEPPSLLHGDLWSGNSLCTVQSVPVLIDPAVYYGHRSMDLAMTTLFGGFDKAFYETYDYYFPLPANYAEQWDICNLYPLLIHLNLFGKSYLPAITAILKKFD